MGSRLRLAATSGRRVAPPAGALTFDVFFEEEAHALFRRMCLVTGDRLEAEEIVQDAFLALFERWDKIQAMDDPVGYLYRTAFDRWKRLARRASRHLRELAGIAQTMDAFASVDEQDSLDRALATLTPRQRAAIVLTEMLGYTSVESARILGIRDVTVRTLASQGRATLRRTLEGGDE